MITQVMILFLFGSSLYARQYTEPLTFQYTPSNTKTVLRQGFKAGCTGYYFSADKTTQKKPISTLLFGSSMIKLQDAHYQRQTIPQFPFADQPIQLSLSWKEGGVVLYGGYTHTIDQKCMIGMELLIPYTHRTITNHAIENGMLTNQGETIDDVLLSSSSLGVVTDMAMRFDFMQKLPMGCALTNQNVRLYNPSNTLYGDVPTVGGVVLTDNIIPQINQHPLTLLYQTTKPTMPCKIPVGLGLSAASNMARGLPALEEDGTINNQAPTNGMRARFVYGKDYSLLPQASFKDWWLVPSTTDTVPQVLIPRAQVLANGIKSLLSCIATSAQDELTGADLNVASVSGKGFGDLVARLYGLYKMNKTLVSFGAGLVLPTGGKRLVESRKSLCAIDNRAELQCFIDGAIRYSIGDSIAVNGNVGLYAILPHEEYVNASFVGAQLKNLGPVVPADISAYAMRLGIATSWSGPRILQVQPGISVGYECYLKSEDHITYRYNQGYDWSGVLRSLSSDVAARDSGMVRHTVTVSCDIATNYFHMSAGYRGAFAGRNTILSHGSFVKCMILI